MTVAFQVAVLGRQWTDNEGRKVDATLAEVKGKNVILKLKNGKKVPFPIADLSKQDQKYIVEQKALLKLKEEAELLNFGDEWPKLVRFTGDPEIETIEEDEDSKSYIYESANYRYNCDVRLSKSVVKGFAVLFEATYQYTRELPLAVTGGKKRDGKYQILLFETKQGYAKAGGPPGSGGVYMPSKNLVIVPLTSLGVKKFGSGYILDRDRGSRTLPHELVHQLTPRHYYAPGSRGWFTEGLAEYVAVTPYRSGGFNVRLAERAFIDFVTEYGRKGMGGRALGKEINLGPLRNYMLQPYSSFTGNASLNYGCGLLLVSYFCHMDRDEDAARLVGFLKALREGKHGEAALEVLLDGQTWLELEEEIKKAFKGKGIDFTFTT